MDPANVPAKFEVRSFTRSWDRGTQKIWAVHTPKIFHEVLFGRTCECIGQTETDRQTDRRHAISVYHAMQFASRGKKQHTISLMIPSHIKRITPCREGPLVRRSYNTLGTKLVTCRSSVDSQSLTLKFVWLIPIFLWAGATREPVTHELPLFYGYGMSLCKQ